MKKTSKKESPERPIIAKFSIDRDVFFSGLKKVCGVVANRTTIPVLSNVRVTATDQGVSLETTDLEIAMKVRVDANVEMPGVTTIPAKRLLDIVKALRKGDLSFEVDENHASFISAGKSSFKIFGISHEEFPEMFTVIKSNQIDIEQGVLREALIKTSYAMSSDETRYVLNGCLFRGDHSKFLVVATDGRRLAVFEMEADTCNAEMILPAKAVSQLKKLLNVSGNVLLWLEEGKATFMIEDVVLVSKLVEGKFPDINGIVPTEISLTAKVPREKLLDALRRTSLMCVDKGGSVRFKFSSDSLVLETAPSEIGDAREEIPIEADGEISIAFNPVYMLEALSSLDDEMVSIELADSASPAVVKAPFFKYILMPMRLA